MSSPAPTVEDLKDLLASVPPQELTMYIPIDSVFIGEKRKKRFDPKNVENHRFVTGIDKIGLINPVDVRPARDKEGTLLQPARYELCCGRRRLWALKQLGHTEILARIGEWSDDELFFLTCQENALRQHLTPVQHVAVIQELMKLYEKLFGEDPGRRIGGWARAAAAERDPVTKRFLKGSKKPEEKIDVSPDTEGDEPANPSVGFAGSEAKPEPQKGHVARVHEEIGKGLASSQAEARLARIFTPEQLNVLGTCEQVSKADLDKLSRVKHEQRRNVAINLVCAGSSVDSAIAEAMKDTPEMQKVIEDRKEELVPDQEWVETYCKKRRTSIQDPRVFDAAAILYRRTRDGRAQFRAKAGKEIKKAHDEHPNRLTWILGQALYVAHPRDWCVCNACYGLNSQEPNCPKCRGAGFEVVIEWPKKTAV